MHAWTPRLCLALAAAGCSLGPEASLPSADESRAFQARYESKLRDEETSALHAVASYYVQPGQTLALGLRGRTVVTDASEPLIAFGFDDDGFRCTKGCGAHLEGSVEAATTYGFGPMTVEASPQSGSGRVMVFDPESEAAAGFEGLQWFSVEDQFIVSARFTKATDGEPETLTTSRGLTKALTRHGSLAFELGGVSHRLVGYAMGPGPEGSTSILVPFGDETNDAGSYPQGRYLSVDVPEGAKMVALDFNRATNPLCAYSEHYNCPIPPASNRLTVEVRAGERYEAHERDPSARPTLQN